VVGTPRELIRAAALGAAVLAAPLAPAAESQPVTPTGSCRDGLPHGAYELRDAGGRLRVSGAFNRGKRTSSFIFWSSAGVRLAHLPYDEGVLSGTVSLWYADSPRRGEPQQKLEAAYVAGSLDGSKRSWHANGAKRAVFVYARGALVEAQAWSAAGAQQGEPGARALAERDATADRRYYESLEAMVDQHPPRCDAPAAPTPGTQATR